MTNRLYTIADLSKATGIPESTIRNYRKRFEIYIETVDDGSRYPKYTDEARNAVVAIANEYKRGKSHSEVASLLNAQFAHVAHFDAQEPPDSDQTALATISPAEALTIVAQSMQIIANYKSEVEALRDEVKELREAITSLSHTAATQEPHESQSEQYTQSEPPDQPQTPKRRKWWRFGKD